MKNKIVAGVLALTFGGIGVHQFYLGKTTKGIFYAVFFWTFIPTILAIVDAIIILSMDDRQFDEKYNWKYLDEYYRNLDSDYDRRRYEEQRRWELKEERRNQRRQPAPPPRETPASVEDWRRERALQKQRKTTPKSSAKPSNPYRESGIQKFKAYDFEGAIEDFEKALDIDPQDVASHFNLACAYSITEEKAEAFFHLDRAVKYGFKDFERIRTHDALAFLRIQDEFHDFQSNTFRLSSKSESVEKNLNENGDLLDQLQKLAELRDKGLLTNEEFTIQKKRLLD